MMKNKTVKLIIIIIFVIIAIFTIRTTYVCIKISNSSSYKEIVNLYKKYVHSTRNKIIKKTIENRWNKFIFDNNFINGDYEYIGDYYDKVGTYDYLEKKNINTIPVNEVEYLSVYFKDKNNVYLIPTIKLKGQEITDLKNIEDYKKYSYKITDTNFYIEKYEKRDYDESNFDDASDSFSYDIVDTKTEEHLVVSLKSNTNSNDTITFYYVDNGLQIYVFNSGKNKKTFDKELYYDFYKTSLEYNSLTDFNQKFADAYSNMENYVSDYSDILDDATAKSVNITGKWRILSDSEESYVIKEKEFYWYKSNDLTNDYYYFSKVYNKTGFDALYTGGVSNEFILRPVMYNLLKSGLEDYDNVMQLNSSDYSIVKDGNITEYKSSKNEWYVVFAVKKYGNNIVATVATKPSSEDPFISYYVKIED